MTAAYFEDHPTDPEKMIMRKPPQPELTEEGLEAMLTNIRKHLDETGDRVTAIPRYFMVRPADLENLGLTVDEVTKMIKEKNT
jgi:hypothetical protein